MCRWQLLLAAVILVAVAAYILWPKAPAIVNEIQAMPEAARVEWVGPAGARLTVVHLRDWHYVPRHLYELEGLNFDEVCQAAAAVQESQLAIARHLIKAHGLKIVYSEGLSEESRPALQLRLDVLKDLPPAAESDAAVRQLALEIRTPGRLWLAGDIGDVLPLDDEKALQDAKPVADGKIARNEAKIETQRKAMVDRLPASGALRGRAGVEQQSILGRHSPLPRSQPSARRA